MHTIKHENKNVVIMGDFNIDLLKFEMHNKTNFYIDNIFSNAYIPLITKPTRLTPHSATLIDHIYTNDISRSYKSGIIITDIADHFGIFTIIQNIIDKPKPKTITIRSYKESNLHSFRNLLQKRTLLFNTVTAHEHPDIAYEQFMNIYADAYEEAFPLKTIKVRKKLIKQEPWVTKGLIISSINKDKLFRKKLNKPNDININNFTKYNKIFNKIKRAAKKMYYTNIFATYKTDSKQTWSILRQIINKSKKSNSLPSTFVIDNNKISNPQVIAEEFNNFFSKIGQSVSDNVPNSQSHYTDHLKGQFPDNFNLIPVDPVEILKTAKQMKPKTSQGHDNISTKLLKETIDLILIPLTHIINQSFTSGIVPGNMKIAKIIPIFKSGNQEIMNNYRPISLLPAFSKLLEKLVYKKLTSFLESYKILYKHQYGFRKKHSTIHPILHLLKYIAENNDKPTKDLTLAVFIDLSKAFDTICHSTLLKKLNFYGIRGITNSWFHSYLTQRKQYTIINNCKSALEDITCGVPQGSILGPILFLIYINDIQHSTSLNLLSYADDTTIYSSNSNADILYAETNKELIKLDDWFRANKLSLNVKKTNYSIFSPTKFTQETNRTLTLNNTTINREHSIRFLGLNIDQQLTWNTHINKLKSKISSSIFIINRVKKQLPHKALKSIYLTLIHSHFIYGITAWGNFTTTNKLYLLQKKALRLINNKAYASHTDPLFKQENVLKFHDIYKVVTALHVHDLLANKLPSSFDNFFPMVNHSQHNRITRQYNNLPQTLARTQFSARTPYHAIPALWNNLQLSTQTTESRTGFKKIITQQIITQYKSEVTCNNPRCPDCRS